MHLDLSIQSLFSVKGQVALVTGGGSGIGTMIATALVQNGAKVCHATSLARKQLIWLQVYISSRKEKQLQEVSELLNKTRPESCHYFVADLSVRITSHSLSYPLTFMPS